MTAHPDQPPVMRVLSLGAGVQSTALLLMSTRGDLPKLDAAIFADTGWEPRAVYDHLDRLEAEVAQPAGVPLYRVSSGNIRDDALDPSRRSASIPLHIRNHDGSGGIARRQCTSEYKLKPIKAKVRELLGYPHPTPVPRGVHVKQWIGISLDEVGRARDSDVKYAVNTFPLLDRRMTRDDCKRYLRRHGWGATVKSACIGCPFHGNRAWRELRENAPEEWADAVEFDAAIRNGSTRIDALMRGSVYLHRSLVPLGEAPIDRVTRGEWTDRQTDVFGQIADADEEEYGEAQGCSPFGCPSEQTGPAA